MSSSRDKDKNDGVDFSWGVKRGHDRKKDLQYYESFTYDGVDYSLYDSVYLFKEGELEPYIGKLIRIWENPNKARKVKVLWFFYPSEISNFVGDEDVLQNEIFLASGEAVGMANINRLEAIAGKCNVVCISKDERNRPPSNDELEMADYVFYRTFDVRNFTISDKMGEKIAATEVRFLLNKKDFQPSDLGTYRDAKDFSDKSKYRLRDGDGPSKTSRVALPATELVSVSGHKIRLKSPASKQADFDKDIKHVDENSVDSFPSSTAGGKRKSEVPKFFHKPNGGDEKLKPTNSRYPLEERPFKKLKLDYTDDKSATVSMSNKASVPVTAVTADTNGGGKLAKEVVGESNGLSSKLKFGGMIEPKYNDKSQKAALKQTKDVEIEYGRVEEVTRRPDYERSRWLTPQPWEEMMKDAHDQGTLVLLQNLDPTYTSSEVEDIVWTGFRESCTAKMVQRTATSDPHSGQAFAVFKSKDVVEKVARKIDQECLMLPNGRPLLCRVGVSCFPTKQAFFPGSLVIDKLRLQMSRESRNAVSTSHPCQTNTVEYEMAMEWRLLQDRGDWCLKRLYKQQRDESRKLTTKFKLKKVQLAS